MQQSILPFLDKANAQPSERPNREHSRPGQPYHPRPSNHNARGSPSAKHRGQGPDRRRNMDLKKIADETKEQLPKIIQQLPGFQALESSVHDLDDLAALDSGRCPGFELPAGDVEAGKKGTRITVWDTDTFDAAIALDSLYTASVHLGPSPPSTDNSSRHATEGDQAMVDASQTSDPSPDPARMPVAVLNLASERSAGGGWQNGALAQEEALCYRSSLYLSLHKNYYPLPSLSAIYSPSVLIIRDAMSRGHNLLVPTEQPSNLPVTSVISVAALRYPALSADGKHYKNEGQRAETKRKIRLTLRLAAHKGHTRLVLGALGCGVFGNPPKEVAQCFLEVMQETEFLGGWWEEVVFAIMDNVRGENGGKNGVGNYGEFYRVLDGQVI